MTPMAGQADCFKAKEDLIALAVPDTPELSINQRFFPRNRIQQLLTEDRVLRILQCHCPQCQKDAQYQVTNEGFHEYASRIVGSEGQERNPANTAVSLLALLIYIGRPHFIIGFLLRDGGANDNTFETAFNGVTIPALQDRYWPRYKRLNVNGASSLAAEFKWHMNQFAVPHMNDSGYSVYDERTIMPFVNETPIGHTEDGEFINPGAYGKVFAFEIWPEYNKFPHATKINRFARKELKDTPPKWFHAEKDNLEKVKRLKDDHIVKIIKAYRHGQTFNIIFPLAKTNLRQYLRDPHFHTVEMNALPELNPMWKQVLGLIKALHRILTYDVSDSTSHDLTSEESFYGFHFDIKPENILVQNDNSFVISDFGQATFLKVGGTSSRVVGNGGTDAFAPPEVDNLNVKHSRKYDIWSLGCIVVDIATFVAQGRSGLLQLDEIRHTKLENSNKEDDRFFERKPGTEGFRMKPDILTWINSLPVSPRIRSDRSQEFMRAIVSLALKMLTIDVERRIQSHETLQEMTDILRKFQTDQTTPRPQGQPVPDGDEIVVEAKQLSDIEKMRFLHDQEWVRASLHVFEAPGVYLRMVIQLNNSSHNHYGARSDVTLVPRYMWDLEDRGEPGSSLYFSPLSGRSPRSFSGVRFLFSDPKGVPFLYFCGLSLFNQISEALIVQSVLTGQRIYHSFGLKSGSYEVAPSLTRKFVCFFKGGKSSLGARPDNVPSAVQLWSEMEYKNLMPQKTTNRNAALVPQPVRPTINPFEAARRRVVILYRDRIVTIPMAKNVRIQEPTLDSLHKNTLTFIPTDKAKDKYFCVSQLYPTRVKRDEDPFPGIPLCKTRLRDAENENEFDCRSFKLEFRRREDIDEFMKKYKVLKENWAKDTDAILTKRPLLGRGSNLWDRSSAETAVDVPKRKIRESQRTLRIREVSRKPADSSI